MSNKWNSILNFVFFERLNDFINKVVYEKEASFSLCKTCWNSMLKVIFGIFQFNLFLIWNVIWEAEIA